MAVKAVPLRIRVANSKRIKRFRRNASFFHIAVTGIRSFPQSPEKKFRGLTVNLVGLFLIFAFMEPPPHGDSAVSYTHLDVYKRQPYV